jgi:predicted  nucleic acid-binding Zn-ribbon protein
LFVSAAIVMLKNRLLLSVVTGGVGFGLSLLILRDFKMAAYTGLIGFVASQAGVLVTSSQYEDHLHDRREELRRHIRALQGRRTEVYDDLAALQAQFATLQAQVQQQPRSRTVATPVGTANPWHAKPSAAARVSWDLTAPRRSPVEQEMDDLEHRLQALAADEADLAASLNQSLHAKQQADLHRTTSEAELQQLRSQIAEQTALKQTLHQTILELEQQQQQLQTQIPQLQTQIQALEADRTKRASEAKREREAPAAPSAGSVALQGAIDQMQSQITALRSELGDLETQILDRRNQKQLLDQAIQQQQTIARETPRSAPSSPVAPPPTTRLSEIAIPPVPTSPKPTTPKAPAKATTLKPRSTPDHGLTQEWIAFKSKLQPYEFQALCAIALEENPTSVLKRLAESNLTMPEMLIDTINEQALESIGDLILEAGRDAASTIIAQEYRDEVATLIATHR